MGGSSGIALIDNINPMHNDPNSGSVTVGNFFGSFTDNVRDNQQGVALVGGFALGGAAATGLLGGAVGAGAAGAAAEASSTGVGAGYLGASTGAAAAETGVGYLGASTSLTSGTGVAAAGVGGAATTSAAAINYSSGYLGANIGGSAFGSSLPSGLGYLGVDTALSGGGAASTSGLGYLGVNTALTGASESSSLLSYLPSAKDALTYYSAYNQIARGNYGAAADTLKGSPIGGYIPNVNIQTPNAPDWLSGLTNLFGSNGGAGNQSGASVSYPTNTASSSATKTALLLVAAVGALYIAKKKRMI